MNDEQKQTAAVAGVGLAACAVCCAGPIVAAVGVSALGPIGIGAAAVVGAVAVVRHRRRAEQSPADETEPDHELLEHESIIE